MRIFRKTRGYSIATDNEGNFKVQHFAHQHSVNKSTVHIRLVSDVILVNFFSKENSEEIIKALKNELGENFNIRVEDNFIYVTKK